MTLHIQKLYIGTSWGCLIITEADTLRPITVFRPFCDEVQAIIPATNLDQGFLRQVPKKDDENESYIITLGMISHTLPPKSLPIPISVYVINHAC